MPEMEPYSSFSEIIDDLGGSAGFGRIIGKPIGTASAMKTRDIIPPAHWDATVRGAAALKKAGVTHELLSRLYTAKRAAARVAA